MSIMYVIWSGIRICEFAFGVVIKTILCQVRHAEINFPFGDAVE